MRKLDNRLILITGAASGIGRAAALCCAREGANIIAVDLDAAGIESCIQELAAFGITSTGFTVDIQDETQVTDLFAQIKESFDQIDGVIHAAGILEGALVPIDDFNSLTWDRVIDINLKGSFLIAKQAVPLLEKSDSGVLILISSGAGVKGGSSSVAYGSSKGGVHGLSLVLAAQLASRDIRVHAVCPGALATPLKMGAIQAQADKTGANIDDLAARLGDPDGVGKILAFLVSDDANYVRGTIFTR
jgi:NAD(P)-dependent dehydrogenase (short-subunit alcohol dehydrogenase family)